MECCARPILGFMLAIAALAAAPACLAQQVPAAADGASPQARANEAESETAAPRSAFGKVMSVLISALQKNAEAGSITPRHASSEYQPAAVAGPPPRDIQVSAAFQLAPAANSGPASPATASID